MKYNLIILATGLNSGSVDIAGFPYSAPATLPIVIRELSARKDDIQEYFGNSVRAFLIPRSKLTFGTLVPKDGFVNTSLLGKNDPLDIEKFLEHETVRKAMPFDYKEACSCRPRIGIGMASNFYSDGFVAIGDAAVSRLYKDGMGSAFLTARQAAQTAIYYGTSMEAFRIHYAPLCNEIRKDNRLGHLLFAVHHQFKDSAYFFRAHLKLIESATSTPGVGQSFSRILWGMFTGSYTYREIWGMVKKPRTLLRLVIEFVREKMK
jgi:flavin-dependent dehydrogenase